LATSNFVIMPLLLVVGYCKQSHAHRRQSGKPLRK